MCQCLVVCVCRWWCVLEQETILVSIFKSSSWFGKHTTILCQLFHWGQIQKQSHLSCLSKKRTVQKIFNWEGERNETKQKHLFVICKPAISSGLISVFWLAVMLVNMMLAVFDLLSLPENTELKIKCNWHERNDSEDWQGHDEEWCFDRHDVRRWDDDAVAVCSCRVSLFLPLFDLIFKTANFWFIIHTSSLNCCSVSACF